MDKSNAAYSYSEIESERYKRDLLYSRTFWIDKHRKALGTGFRKRLQAWCILALHDYTIKMGEGRNERNLDLHSCLLSNIHSLHSRLKFLQGKSEQFDVLRCEDVGNG